MDISFQDTHSYYCEENMAKNIQRSGPCLVLSVPVTHPSNPASGDAVRYGHLTGVALTNEGGGGNTTNNTSMGIGLFVVRLSVHDAVGTGITVGSPLFFHDTPTGTPNTSINNSSANGYFYGIALNPVSAGATTSIDVFLSLTPGAGSLANGGVGTTQLADAGVTAAKLTTTLATGFIPIPLTSLRSVTSNALPAASANGGLLASDTTPILNMSNGDTDSALRVSWEASVNTPIVFQVALAPDLDVSMPITLHVRAFMSGTTDTPVLDSDSYFNESDTKVEDASAAITGATPTEYIITIASADIPADAQTMTCEITPSAHTTDSISITSLWVEYKRV